ncbi:hypothetical protein VTN77DRAFT_8540 [Rasamsonia byssochlamydoides]|uniref:uncharacterized protein n=1 Tax=Rasamsonia byssochlamydoides TaxID=89139 RepID=UPI003743ACDD
MIDSKLEVESQSHIMAHPYITRQEPFDDFNRQQKTTTNFPVRPCAENEEQQGHLVRSSSSGQISSASDFDSKNRPPPRRRIQVACGRCRKRKIKCSGDSGDGQGCSNCRSSGTPNCQFLRVNSSELQTKTAYQSYPYPIMTTAQTASYGTRLLQKASGSMHSPTLRTMPYLRSHSVSDLGALGQSVSLTRGPYTTGCNLNYEDVCSATYSPAYMLPSASSASMVSYCGSPGSPKSWNPSTGLSRTQSAVFYHDQDPASSLGAPAYSYASPASYPSLSVDVPSLFPAITSLSTCDGSDRTLPTPTSRQQLDNIGTNSRSAVMMSGLPFCSEQVTHRISNVCDLKTTAATSTEASTETVSCSLSPLVAPRTVPSTSQDMLFSYVTLPSSSSPGPVTSTTAYTGADTVESAEPADTPSVSRTGSDLLGLESSSCDVYGYSSSSGKSKRHSDAAGSMSSGTLMNGQQYTRLRQSDSLGSSSFSFLRSDPTADFQTSTAPHGTSIASLNNPGCY